MYYEDVLWCRVDDGSGQCHMDSQLESTTVQESSLEPAPLTQSSITPTPNIVYLNDWFGSQSFSITDAGNDRYGMLPHSEAGCRLWRKQQRRKQRRAEDSAMTWSEDVDDFKGTLPVDELLAFINSAKTAGESSNCKIPSSTPSKKERKIRRKKKPASDWNEDSDQASVSTVDTSSCSGYEAVATIDSIADAELEISRLSAVPDECSRSLEVVQDMDYESAANEHDHFVVVQKKKKGRQPVSQLLPPRYGRPPYSAVTMTQAIRSRPPALVSTGYETCRTDGTTSLTSDTESSSSYARDGCSHAASVRSTSPDFPDLAVQNHTAHGRRNLTGNLAESIVTSEKLPVPPSTISYAVVAAGGLRPDHSHDMEWRHSLDSSADANIHGKQLEVTGSSAEYFSSSSISVEDSNSSNILPENLVGMPSRTCLLYTSPSPRDRQKSRMPSSA